MCQPALPAGVFWPDNHEVRILFPYDDLRAAPIITAQRGNIIVEGDGSYQPTSSLTR